MQKVGGPNCHPAVALLIRGSELDPRWVRNKRPDQQSEGRRGHAHSSLSSSPPARGRPTCRVQEPARAVSRGGSHRERASTPSVPSERDRAPPRKPEQALPWTSLRTTSQPLLNGAWVSTLITQYQLNEESAIRDPIDGGCGNLTLRPAEGRRGSVLMQVGELAPIALNRPRLGGLTRGYTA
jgi:hypothetical protein